MNSLILNSWVVFTLVLVSYLFSWYRSTLWLARRMNENAVNLNDDDRRFHLGMAMFIMLCWPVVRPVMELHARMLSRVPPTTAEMKAENTRVKRENTQLHLEIARLERENDIGQDGRPA